MMQLYLRFVSLSSTWMLESAFFRHYFTNSLVVDYLKKPPVFLVLFGMNVFGILPSVSKTDKLLVVVVFLLQLCYEFETNCSVQWNMGCIQYSLFDKWICVKVHCQCQRVSMCNSNAIIRAED